MDLDLMRIQEIAPPLELTQQSFETGLVVLIFNRSRYVKKCFDSLSRSNLKNTVLLIIDDGSYCCETLKLVQEFSIPGVPVVKIFRKTKPRRMSDVAIPFFYRHRKRAGNYGIHECLLIGWRYLLDQYDCKYLANLDSDTIVNRDWLEKIKDLYRTQRQNYNALIVTGFNSPTHPVIESFPGFVVKKSIGGLNVFFESDFLIPLIKPCLIYEERSQVGWDWHLVQSLSEKGYPIICTNPSVIQHIGKVGRFSFLGRYDYAKDFITDRDC